MGNRLVLGLLVLTTLALGGGVALFWVQNAARTTQLSLDLGFAAWQLAEPVSIPVLVASSLGGGVLLGLALAAWWSLRRAARRRRVEAPYDEPWR